MVVRKGKTGEQTEAIQLLEYQIRVEGGLISSLPPLGMFLTAVTAMVQSGSPTDFDLKVRSRGWGT